MDESNTPKKVPIEASVKPKLVGAAAFKNSLGDLAGDLAEPGIILAAGGTASQAAWGGLRGVLISRVLGPLGLISGVVLGIGFALKMVVGQTRLMADGLKEAKGMENLITQFKPLLGGIQAAKNRLAELFQFAASTPFSIKGIAEASRLLEIMTNGALSTSAGLRMIGDAAAVAGRPLEEVAFWVGRLKDAMDSGGPTGEAMMRLQEMGVVSGSVRREIEQLTTAGASARSTWALVEKELRRNEGGMKSLSQTATGLTSTLADARDAMARGFGNNFLEREKDGIKAAIVVTEAFTPVIAELGEHLRKLSVLGDLSNKIKQNKAAMEAVAAATTTAMHAFILFGTAALFAQAAVTFRGISGLIGNLGSLKSALKLAARYNFNFVKASKAATSASILSARATRLEAFAKTAATVADKKRALSLAALNSAKASTILRTNKAGKAMIGASLGGRALQGVLKLLGGVVGLVGSAFTAAFAVLATTLGAASAGVGLLLATWYLWNRSTQQQTQYLKELRAAQRDSRDEAVKMAAAAKTLQDQQKNETTLIAALTKAYRDLAEAKKKDKDNWRGNKDGIKQAETGVEKAKKALEENKAEDRKPDERKRADKTRQIKLEQQIADVVFQGAMQRGTGEEKAFLIAQRRKELEERIAAAINKRDGDQAEEDKDTVLANELKAAQGKLDVEKDYVESNVLNGKVKKAATQEEIKAAVAADARMQILKKEIALIKEKQNKRLDETSESVWTDADIKANNDLGNLNSLETEKESLAQQQASADKSSGEASGDADRKLQISNLSARAAEAIAKGRWDEADAMRTIREDAEKQLFIQQRIRALQSSTDMTSSEAKLRAEAEYSTTETDKKTRQDTFRRDQALDIAANEARIGGRPKQARAIEDGEALRKLVQANITQGGMGAEEAQAMAERQMSARVGAEEQGKGSQVVADQFQRLGLGGHASGSDPAQRARDRMVAAQKETNKKLGEILDDRGPM
jgi:hypothetical protein